MTASNLNLTDGLILKEDLYKDNTLLLKKGIILNAYLINKLNKFGFYTNVTLPVNEEKKEISALTDINTEVLIYQHNVFDVNKTKKVLEYAGFEPSKIFTINNINKMPFGETDISFIFVDSLYYDENFIEDVTLLNSNKKITVFVLGCDVNIPQKLNFNTDLLTVKFLYRPLANDYIKALLNLYS